MENLPETFIIIHMLFIKIEVNRVPITALVDCGAQMTCMSEVCAERCGIMRLVDTRYVSIATGVGVAKILGRVHLAPLKINNSSFPCSFTVIEGQSIDFLLGLDILRRYQAILDVKNNVLKLGDEEIQFLREEEIPESQQNRKIFQRKKRSNLELIWMLKKIQIIKKIHHNTQKKI